MNLSTKPDWWTETNAEESDSSVFQIKNILLLPGWKCQNAQKFKTSITTLCHCRVFCFKIKYPLVAVQRRPVQAPSLHTSASVWTIWHSDQLIGLLRHTILYPNTQQADRTQPLPTLPQFKCTQDKTLNLGGHNRSSSIAASPKREDRPITYTPFHSHAQFLWRTVIPTQLCWGHMAGPAMG